MAKWSAKVEAEQAAHEATRRELAAVSKSHALLRDFVNNRGLADDLVAFIQERDAKLQSEKPPNFREMRGIFKDRSY